MRLPTPSPGHEAHWVGKHLSHLTDAEIRPSSRWRGTQAAADHALAAATLDGYASTRSVVAPVDERGATGLSPWIRHGMITLPAAWAAAGAAPERDRTRFRDELRWQEYARHLGARVDLRSPLRPGNVTPRRPDHRPDRPARHDPWQDAMTCVADGFHELRSTGWIPNQVRLWLASHWAVHRRADWRSGEERFFRELLDGSRAANRLGWQWVTGTATGRPYAATRASVERLAPGSCARCPSNDRCPWEHTPRSGEPTPPNRSEPTDSDSRRRHDPDPEGTAGPREVRSVSEPDTVWITAESMGRDDPALRARPHLPVVFVFDERLLARVRLAPRRLVFLTERLAELAAERDVQVHLGDVVEILATRAVAATFTPVSGWRRRAERLAPAEVHPWPWLRRPIDGPVTSFSAWSRSHGDDRPRRS